MLNDPMEELRIQLEDIPAVNESIKRIKLILDMKNKLTYGDEILKGSIEEIEIQDMSFSYDEEYIFRHFNRKFDKGKVYGLIGASGSGKSTLINSLVGEKIAITTAKCQTKPLRLLLLFSCSLTLCSVHPYWSQRLCFF